MDPNKRLKELTSAKERGKPSHGQDYLFVQGHYLGADPERAALEQRPTQAWEVEEIRPS